MQQFIDIDLDTTLLEIKTDTEIGRFQQVIVDFHDKNGLRAGGITFYFSSRYSTPQYSIHSCVKQDFPTRLPDATEKVWRIKKTKSSGIGIQVHCNDVKVLDVVLSDELCSTYSSWNTVWSKDMVKMSFHDSDTASDYYRLSKGKYSKTLFIVEPLPM